MINSVYTYVPSPRKFTSFIKLCLRHDQLSITLNLIKGAVSSSCTYVAIDTNIIITSLTVENGNQCSIHISDIKFWTPCI
jgi:hypothetical protein